MSCPHAADLELPLSCHLVALRCGGEMGLWRIRHPTYGVIYDEAQVSKRGPRDPACNHPVPEAGGVS
jgi:hypothetical protein